MTKQEIQKEALSRALYGKTWSNYPQIFRGFLAKGIKEQDIKPRENVFTYQAWRALGRQVKRGEHGVKISSWIPVEEKDKDGKKTDRTRTIPRTVTVFHVSQTDALEQKQTA